jgi:F-type H+-transporting ATPase subunit a
LNITPDQVIGWQGGPIVINATLIYTWLIMVLLVVLSRLVTRRLSTGPSLSGLQNLLEVVVDFVRQQIAALGQREPERYLPFVGTLFIFIAVSNLLSVVPGFLPPTGSLSTTTALAACVFSAVPWFGIRQQGVMGYLRNYTRPSVLMLPFNIIGEFSRSLALAVRLFGNIMSGSMIGAILLTVPPLFFPVIMQALGLLIGLIQAYIFAILATVYITAASEARPPTGPPGSPSKKGD